MATRRAFLGRILGTAVAVSAGATACSSGSDGSGSAAGHVKSATAIAVALEYDAEIDTSKLSKSTFTVAGRTVTKVYANTGVALADRGSDGRYVIVELSPDDSDALLWGGVQSGMFPGGGQGGGSASPQPSTPSSATASSTGAPVLAGPSVGATAGPATIKTAKGSVVVGDDYKPTAFFEPPHTWSTR
ncbi:hypothetical protein [Streptomyces sp. NPDC048277]|uniref:hypothetical protein n=1 Tax=Streptomyces sp. NPDC048277 TaxID=3155027 RepID=UPI00340C3665